MSNYGTTMDLQPVDDLFICTSWIKYYSYLIFQLWLITYTAEMVKYLLTYFIASTLFTPTEVSCRLGLIKSRCSVDIIIDERIYFLIRWRQRENHNHEWNVCYKTTSPNSKSCWWNSKQTWQSFFIFKIWQLNNLISQHNLLIWLMFVSVFYLFYTYKGRKEPEEVWRWVLCKDCWGPCFECQRI